MKRITTLITAFVALSFFAAVSTHADVIWQELFNYPDGCIETNSGGLWICHSPTPTPARDAIVVDHRLQNAATGASTPLNRQDDIHRNFLGGVYTNTQIPVYASFIVNCTNLPNAAGTYFAHFYTNSTIFHGKLYALVGTNLCRPNTWRLGVSGASSTVSKIYPIDLATNQDYQVVVEWDPYSSWSATIWVNPVSSADTSVFSSDTVNPPVAPALAFAFRQASSFGNWFATISNLVVATTFAEAATNVWATNAVPPKVVYQPVGVTNFTGSSFSLSAVANGQGLGNLTYQWQVSAAPNNSNPVNVSGGNFSGVNANILTDNNAQTGDSGYYTLVVTTPWGLSATSSVAAVSISAAPVPPSFITQPVSQTAYRGQTVIFSTTVSSPGNITYTWYSNNVVVTAGVNSSGSTSTLELDNVTTNFSASYKVAVTNDVVPTNGIVSSNAVLTVLNPAHVSIAYLRTLVDPATYAPTNVPPTIPYEVTGIVTTFTNITSGNTSSYYLQDGTAGINIFVTYGSTFRPAQGDVVTYVGVLSLFTSGLELYANLGDPPLSTYTGFTDLSNNIAALPALIAIPYSVTNNLNNLNYVLAGSLVKITDVHFGTNAGTTISTSANEWVTVTNASGQPFELYFAYYDQDTAGKTLPAYAYSVSGPLYGFNTNAIVVTKFSDIVTTVPTPIPLNMSFSGGNVTFTWSDSSFVLQSATNVLGPYITIPGAASGFITNTTSKPTMFFRLYYPDP